MQKRMISTLVGFSARAKNQYVKWFTTVIFLDLEGTDERVLRVLFKISGSSSTRGGLKSRKCGSRAHSFPVLSPHCHRFAS